eukprot:TRINITY_DN1138_c0_g1_i1.p1 TRINITY_DN1138_c0_g1~~TRINITY_DN1138_c0_g1_i1.p1  ORF type:complete len:147 (-),score=42.30 TRINITY_DN1138_c0_g1_i1:405-845(-)
MVLKGATRTLKRTQFLLLEASIVQYNKGAPLAAEIIAALDTYGFQVADFVEMHYYDNIAFQVDILFVRRSSNRVAIIDETGAHIPAADAVAASSSPSSSSDIQSGAAEITTVQRAAMVAALCGLLMFCARNAKGSRYTTSSSERGL